MPEFQEYELIKYDPSTPANVIVGVVYAIQSIIFCYHLIRHRDRWAICLPLGALSSSVGFFLRLGLDPKNTGLVLFVMQNLLIIATPSAFLAFNYMLYNRFISAIDPQFSSTKPTSRMERSRYSMIPPRIVGRTFVLSDITTFIIQITAGSIMGAAGDENASLANFGDKLYLAGVCAQGITYILFTVLLSVAIKRLIAERQRAGSNRIEKTRMGLDQDTFTFVAGLYFSSLFVVIRSVYRIVELAQGHQGYLMSKEVYLFVLDAAPLIIAIGIWAIIWPTVLLNKITARVHQEAHTYSMEDGISQLRLASN